jgi:UPF0755 protein
MVLASIVGQNGATPEQRPRVAAVLINRLKAKMKLQSDATVVHGLVGGAAGPPRPAFVSSNIGAGDAFSETWRPP